jgi:hypothetical protein
VVSNPAYLGLEPNLVRVRVWLDSIELDGRMDLLGPLLDALERAKSFAPDAVGLGYREPRQRWSRKTVAKEVEGGLPHFEREAAPRASFHIGYGWSEPLTQVTIFDSLIAAAALATVDDAEALVAVVREVARLGRVQRGLAHPRRDLHLMNERARWDGDKLRARRRDTCWLTLLGEEDVRSVGRARVLATPAHRVEELDDGAIMIVATPALFPADRLELQRALAAIAAHLDPTQTAAAALAELALRDAWAASAAPPEQARDEHDPDYFPPVPVEILDERDARALGDSPVVLVPDFATLAEYAVALAHSKVGRVFNYDEKGVEELDRFLLNDSLGSADEFNLRYFAAPSVGALLGEAMVRELGGTWVPHRDPLLHAVRIGQQSFFPVLRAVLAMPFEFFPFGAAAARGHSLSHLFQLARRASRGEVIPCAGVAATRVALEPYSRDSVDGRSLVDTNARAARFDDQGRLWTDDGDDALCWQIPDGRMLARQGWHRGVIDLACVGDDLYTLDFHGWLRIWNVVTHDQRTTQVGGRSDGHAALVVSGAFVAWAFGKKVYVYRRGESNLRTLEGHSSGVVSVALTQSELVSIATERKVRRWSLPRLTPLDAVPTGKLKAVELAAAGSVVTLGLADGLVVQFPDGVTGARQELGKFADPKLSFDDQGRAVVRSGADVITFDVGGAAAGRRKIDGQIVANERVALSPDLRWAAVTSPSVPGATLRLLPIVS